MSQQNPEIQSPHVPHPQEAIQPDAPDFIETPDVTQVPDDHQPLPVWLYVVCGFFLFLAGSSFTGFGIFGQGLYDQGMGGPAMTSSKSTQTAVADPLAIGKKLYNGNCANCHQSTGEGQPGTYPPIAGSEWVLGSRERLAAIMLHGIAGPLTVKGGSYGSQVMPGWATNFTDDKLADLMTYLRKTWGNSASEVTEKDVSDARAKYTSQATAFCEADLLKIAPHGPDPSDKK